MFSTVVDHFLVSSEGTQSNPSFAQKLCFFQRYAMVKHIAESGLYIPLQKDGYNILFANSFQTMHLLRLLFLMVLMTGTTLTLPKLMKTQKKHKNAMLTYLKRKRGYTLT